MGRLPYMTVTSRETTRQVSDFRGLNLGTVIADNEFADMQNMSTYKYPAVSTRKPRGVIERTVRKPNGMYYKNGLVYADGTELFYNGQKIADVEDSQKVFVGMGAYLLVWPDKILYNTSNGEKENLEASWIQSGTVKFEPVVEGATLIRISGTGIGKNFSRYDGVTMSGCKNTNFNKTFIIQEIGDDYIIMTGDLTEKITQSSGIEIKRTVPDMEYLCENENRVWGCSSKNHEIYACKLGDPKNWNSFEGISTDSYAATIGSDGDFTGCVSYLGYVMFFKEDAVHKIYGSKPSNYQIMTSGVNGVARDCEKTIAVVNETLYYVARNGIYAFNGAQPEIISGKLEGLNFKAGTAGLYDNKYYASLKTQDGAWAMYVYDAVKGFWSKEDTLQLYDCVYGEGVLYCISSDGNLFRIDGDRKETIEWYLETGDLLEGSIEYKHVKRFILYLQLEPGAEVNVSVQYDNENSWMLKETFRAECFRSQVVNLIPRRCVNYRIRLHGVGGCTLIGLTRKIGFGTEIHGDL